MSIKVLHLFPGPNVFLHVVTLSAINLSLAQLKRSIDSYEEALGNTQQKTLTLLACSKLDQYDL